MATRARLLSHGHQLPHQTFRQPQRPASQASTARRWRASTRWSPSWEKLDHQALRAKTPEFKSVWPKGESLDAIAARGLRRGARGLQARAGKRHFDVQMMGGTALHQGNIAEMRTGEGKTLTATLPGLPQRADRQGRARRHGERLPGQPRRASGWAALAPLPGPERGRQPAADAARAKAGRLRRRHHLRHQQRVRLRLPARQHGLRRGASACSAAQLRHRRRGGLHPDRRGPHAADHLRPGRGPHRPCTWP